MASCLDLDWGNSRIKWRSGERSGWVAVADWAALPDVAVLPDGAPDRVRVSRVGGAATQDEVGEWLHERYGVVAEFAATTSTLAGLACGYDDPSSLGVDRWLAVVAAWQEFQRPLVVADFGTAITIDFVRGDGSHEGGYIVPGFSLATQALNQQTRLIDVERDRTADDLLPGRSTAQAVARGVKKMVSELVKCAVAELASRCQNAPRHGDGTLATHESAPFLVVCGGDVDLVSPHLKDDFAVRPHLVLDGLEIALP